MRYRLPSNTGRERSKELRGTRLTLPASDLPGESGVGEWETSMREMLLRLKKPTSIEEWEALWATERAAIVKRIKDNKWGKSADGTKLKVRFAPAALSFLPFVWGDYWVLGLADDYSWAVVGSPDRKYLWVLSRTPTLPDDVYAHAIESARTNGFALERVQRTANATPSARTP